MRVTKQMIERARLLAKLNAYSIKLDDNEKQIGTLLGDLPYNDAGQTPNVVCSFTFQLAGLLSVNGGSFVTAVTEEAAHYIDNHCCREYAQLVQLACQRAGVAIDGDLAELFASVV